MASLSESGDMSRTDNPVVLKKVPSFNEDSKVSAIYRCIDTAHPPLHPLAYMTLNQCCIAGTQG